jgi:hypothetical protein
MVALSRVDALIESVQGDFVTFPRATGIHWFGSLKMPRHLAL